MPKITNTNITPAEPTVLIESQPAAISGSSAENDRSVILGEPTVLIGGRPAATLDSQNSVSGKPTVLIGDQPAR
jgi:uncharacterized Zn-binding protein involved in type VI secretion